MSRRNNGPMNGYYALRWQVLERDKFTCQCCGQRAPDTKLEVDHIVSVEDGGQDTLENLRTLCYACNRGRSGLTIQIRRGKTAPDKLPRIYTNIPKKDGGPEKVWQVLQEGKALHSVKIAEIAKVNESNTRCILSRFEKQGKIKRVGRSIYQRG